MTATRKIRDGNLNFTIETRGSDEISELSDALEAMRQRLEPMPRRNWTRSRSRRS